jgi:Magnesium chelatase, subunit ChlI/Magnesium chelatase, subunit ChlI C-terminal
MRAFALALAIVSALAFVRTAHAQNRTFGDFDCTDDCSGHSAGYKWAEKHGVEDEDNCPDGNSQSFHEGCIAYTRDQSLDPDSDDNGNAVGEPLPEPEPDSEDDGSDRWDSYIIPEFQPQALDALRQPLETGEVSIARVNHRVTYPARFMLVAAMNPCRCGHAGDPGYTCRRGVNARCTADYQARISGPLIDRIDLHIEVPAVTAADLILPPPTEGSREVAERVARARERQQVRYAASGLPHFRSNAAVSGAVLEDVARPDASGLSLLREAADAMRLSARGYHRVLRVARTLADLDGADKVGRVHLAEALSYRALTDEIRRAA